VTLLCNLVIPIIDQHAPVYLEFVLFVCACVYIYIEVCEWHNFFYWYLSI